MSTKTQILLLVSLVIVLIVLIVMVKKRRLELKYVLVWFGCDIALIILVCFPQLMNSLAALLGIYSPMNMIFFIGFVLAMIIIFSLTLAMSRVTAKVRRIAQMLSMLPDEVREEILKEDK